VIVRISGEGQFSIDDAATAELNRLDSELEAAVDRNDEVAFTAALHGLLDQVRAHGSSLPADTLEIGTVAYGYSSGQSDSTGRRPEID
jgi:hypothetical protein